MSARQQPLYEVKVENLLQSIPGESPLSYYSHFTNLKKTIDTIQIVLEANGWPVLINYTAVYRQLKIKDTFHKVFVIENTKYFRLSITKHILNPHLTSMGIEEMPRQRRGI